MMAYRRMIGVSVAVVAAMAAIGASALSRLPPNTRLPTHWAADGTADRFASAAPALFTPVAVAAGIALLMALLPVIEPMQRRLDKSATLYWTAWGGMLAVLAFVEAAVAAPAFGFTLPGTWVLALVGLLLVVIGNALPKSRPGFFVGIRTPWTLTDPDNWVATHRLGAWTMIAGGVLLIANAFAPLDPSGHGLLTWSALAIAIVPPIVYSWWYWYRRGPEGGRAAER